MKNSYASVLAVVIFFILSSALFGQDTLVVKAKDTSKAHWSGSFDAAGSYFKGNTNSFLLESGGEIKRADGIVESILAATLLYGETDGIKDDNDFYSSLTFDLFYDNKLSPFVLQLTSFGFAREIDLRSQTGGGLKYTFVNVHEFKSSLSGAVIYDYTNLRESPGNADSRTWRLSMRLKFKAALFGDRINLLHVTFCQPSFKDFTNVIWRSESTLSAPLTEFLFISASYLYTHEDVVPAGVKRGDHKLAFGLGVEFK